MVLSADGTFEDGARSRRFLESGEERRLESFFLGETDLRLPERERDRERSRTAECCCVLLDRPLFPERGLTDVRRCTGLDFSLSFSSSFFTLLSPAAGLVGFCDRRGEREVVSFLSLLVSRTSFSLEEDFLR